MTKIRIDAETGGAKGGLKDVERGVSGVASGVSKITAESRKAEDQLKRLEAQLKRVAEYQKVLSKELGKNVSQGDAETFIRNIEGMRNNGNFVGAKRLRQYDDFLEFHRRNHENFVRRSEADRYRRQVIGAGLSGTRAGEGMNEPRGGGMGGLWRSTRSFAMPMLALAGIGSIMGMAGQGLQNAATEAKSLDQLKRNLGDVNVEFDKLKGNIRLSGEGLALSYIESAKLAQEFAKITNSRGSVDLMSQVRTGAGLGRSFGFEPGQGVAFLANMEHYGVTGSNDPGSRRLALSIAEAIDKGKNTAKADEVLQAVTNFTQQAAHLTLAAPNAMAMAGMMSAMTRAHIPGLDVNGSAALIGSADSAMRRGGAMGEASLNFLYSALGRGLNPVQAQMLMGGGLFGSRSGTFGSKLMTDWAHANGVALPGGGSGTNFEAARSHLRKMYGSNKWLYLDAMKGLFGLQSHEQAAALDMFSPDQLGGAASLVEKSGMKLTDLNASGLGLVARISNAGNRQGLTAIAGDMLRRDDISSGDKGLIKAALGDKNDDQLRETMVRLAGKYGQEMTEGKKTMESVVSIENLLTNIGDKLLPAVNVIRDAVVGIASKIVPDGKFSEQLRAEERARQDAIDKGETAAEQGRVAAGKTTAGGTGAGDAAGLWSLHGKKILAAKDPDAYIDSITQGVASDATRRELKAMAARAKGGAGLPGGLGSVQLTNTEEAQLSRVSGGDPQAMAFLHSVLQIENRGHARPGRYSRSSAGALGPFQFMPGTWDGHGEGSFLSGATDFNKSSKAAMSLYRELNRKYKGNMLAMMAHYNGGTKAGEAVMAGGMPGNSQTDDYVRMAALLNGIPLPQGHSSVSPQQQVSVQVGVDGTIHVQQPNGERTPVKPNVTVAKPQSSGTRPRG